MYNPSIVMAFKWDKFILLVWAFLFISSLYLILFCFVLGVTCTSWVLCLRVEYFYKQLPPEKLKLMIGIQATDFQT